MKNLRGTLVDRLEQYQEYFEKLTELAFAKIVNDRSGLMKLCHAADLFGYDLNYLFDAFSDIQRRDLDETVNALEAI